MWEKEHFLVECQFLLLLCGGSVSKSCVSFASPGVVCNELSDSVRYVYVHQFVNEFMYIHSVNCLLFVYYCCRVVLL